MAISVLILGQSGTGKSASMRNLNAETTALVNVNGKPLPFKTKGSFETLKSDDYRQIQRFIKDTTCKTIVIDDAQYLLANEFMRRSNEKGYDKFTEIAEHYWSLIKSVEKLEDDKVVYFLSHIEEDDRGNQKAKTIGKLLDEKITVEGMFSIVLKSFVTDGRYGFTTQNNGRDTVKSPMGMFNTSEIDNDLAYVDTTIREYYGLVGTPTKVKEVEEVPTTPLVQDELIEELPFEQAEDVEFQEAVKKHEELKERTRQRKQREEAEQPKVEETPTPRRRRRAEIDISSNEETF